MATKTPKSASSAQKKSADGVQVIARNKKAAYDFFLLDKYEAGLSLRGTEVKAIRIGRASLVDSWVEIDRNGEAWLQGAHIPEYADGTWNNHAPRRKRKLLLHREEIAKLQRGVEVKGFTIVPVEIYFVRGYVKIRIALARGKQEWDKRETIRRRQDDLEARRALAQANR